MKKTLLLLFSTIAGLACYSQDTCNSAIAIDLGLHTVAAVNGTEIPSPICAPNGNNATNGEWYTYTPDHDHHLTITTDLPQNNGGDTRFHVYTGSCGALTCYAGDDDDGSEYLSVDSFDVVSGTTYIIAFDDNWNDAGFDFELIEVVPPPPPPVTFTMETISTSSNGEQGVFDLNGDYLDDIVSPNGNFINVHIQEAGGFSTSNISTSSADNSPSWSFAAADFNADGFNDLLYGGGNGVTFFRSNGGTSYTEISLGQYVFSQRSNFVDINNDGNLDAFVCHDVDPNVYYINDGSGNLTFYQGANANGVPSGLGLHPDGGNYGTIWIDFDNDHDSDLFIAKCRGGASTAKINELWRNNGDGTFTEIAGNPGVNMADAIQTWSSAWGDFNNDGFMDGFIGVNSFTDGGHKLMLNDGDGTFTDITASTGLSTYTSGGRENVAHDFDNDGFIDIASNGDLLINNGDMTFTIYPDVFPNNNGCIGDLNNDGFLDSFSGGIYFSDGNTNNWIKIVTVGIGPINGGSNKNGIGARVELYTASGKQIRDVRSGDGFANMSTLNTHFGIGTNAAIDNIIVYWPSGIVDNIPNPSINSTLVITEGQSLSVEDEALASLKLFPNPVFSEINIEAPFSLKGKVATVFDLQGKRVLNQKLQGNSIDVSVLSAGMYILRIEEHGKTSTHKFIKE